MAQFMNPEHQDRYTQAIASLPEYQRSDIEWRSAYYLLTGNAELWRKAAKYLDGHRGEYHWLAFLEREDLTAGTETLARLSVALYNGDGDLRTADLWERLDQDNFNLVMAAIWFRRTG